MEKQIYREARIDDIPQLKMIRHSVKENVLSDTTLITPKDYHDFLTVRGKGWVCEVGGQLVGFAIVDFQDHNIWALFMLPEYEGRGIGRKLHKYMLDWFFSQFNEKVWLSTEIGTRAEQFYRDAGWIEVGPYGNGEIKFEMTSDNWKKNRQL